MVPIESCYKIDQYNTELYEIIHTVSRKIKNMTLQMTKHIWLSQASSLRPLDRRWLDTDPKLLIQKDV